MNFKTINYVPTFNSLIALIYLSYFQLFVGPPSQVDTLLCDESGDVAREKFV